MTSAAAARGVDDAGELWIFAYGSLMWRPGFAFSESAPARLQGWSRRLCVYSWIYRGTPERPGLVFGLDRGGSCRGIAFRVDGEKRDAALAYVRARELVSLAYRERRMSVTLADGRKIAALTYVADRNHEQYAGALDRDARLKLVAQGTGQAGSNRDYVLRTRAFLAERGVADQELEWLGMRL